MSRPPFWSTAEPPPERPQGRMEIDKMVTNVRSAWESGNLVFRSIAGTILAMFDGTSSLLIVPGAVRTARTRFTIAEVNAGATLVAAVAGYKIRMVDVKAIAVGGAAAAVTTVDVLGTQSTSSVKLAAFAQASLTQSTVLRPGVSGTAVLADGASFVANDVATAVTVGKTGPSVTTATHIDVEMQYVLEAA